MILNYHNLDIDCLNYKYNKDTNIIYTNFMINQGMFHLDILNNSLKMLNQHKVSQELGRILCTNYFQFYIQYKDFNMEDINNQSFHRIQVDILIHNQFMKDRIQDCYLVKFHMLNSWLDFFNINYNNHYNLLEPIITVNLLHQLRNLF